MARITPKKITGEVAFFEAVDKVARIEVQLAGIKARRDKEIQAVHEKFKPDLEPLEDQRDLTAKLAEEYAAEHRGELLPKDSKSAESTQAFFGFRLGQPTMKTLSKKWNWEKITEALKSAYGDRFLRYKIEPDKEKLRSELNDAELAEVGLRVDQEDRFYIEPKTESGTRVTA